MRVNVTAITNWHNEIIEKRINGNFHPNIRFGMHTLLRARCGKEIVRKLNRGTEIARKHCGDERAM